MTYCVSGGMLNPANSFVVSCLSLVLWRLPFVNLQSVSVGFYENTAQFTVWFRFWRFQILIRCRANTNDTGENTSIAAVQNSDLRHSGRSWCNGELIIISMLQVATWNNICCWLSSVYVKRSAKNLSALVNKHCLQTTDRMRQGCQMRTKNNVHSNSVI